MPRPLLVVAAAVALSLLGDQLIYVVLPVMHDSVGVPVVSVGLLLSANRWVRLLTNSLAALVVARWGRLWPFVGALVLGGCTTMAYGVLHGVWVWLVARLLWGTAWSFIRLEGLSTALEVATEQTRGRCLGMYQAISRLGGAVAMLAGGILHDLIGFRATFMLFGGLTCAGACLVYYEMSRRPGREAARTVIPASVTPPAASLVPEPSRLDALTRRRMVVASLGTFSNFLLTALVSATLGYMLRQRFGSTFLMGSLSLGVASLTGFLLSTKGFLDLGLAPVTGRLSDRLGRHTMVLTAMPLAIVMVVILALEPPLLVVAVTVILLYIASTALHVTFDAVAGDIVPAGKRRAFLSLFVTWQDMGSATGPLIGYWIAPRFGPQWLYLSGAMLFVLAMLAYGFVFVGATRRSAVAVEENPAWRV
ncbi:MAG: MFS transporter [Candidatus Tectimicrobiota bacterium]